MHVLNYDYGKTSTESQKTMYKKMFYVHRYPFSKWNYLKFFCMI